MKKVWCAGVLALGLLVGCGQSTQPESPSAVSNKMSGLVINGVPVEKGTRPYMAFVKNLTDTPFGCGGAVLARQWILTAAHCTSDSDEDKVTVLVGSLDRTSTTEGEILEVEAFYNHPGWTGEALGGNDISLIKLAKPITHPDVKPIGLPSNQIESILDVKGKFAILSGWGITRLDAPKMSVILHEVTLPIEPNPATCSGEKAPTNTICTPVFQGKSACSGDSGSPLVQQHQGKWYALGVASYGVEDCGGDNTYIRVNAYLDWIKENSGLEPGSEDDWEDENKELPKDKIYEGIVTEDASSFHPFSWPGGELKIQLDSQAEGDFDLYLQRKEGARWVGVARSVTQGHNEKIVYNALKGEYRWEVYSYEGDGSYKLEYID